ncbi:MAG: hypothetical protein ACI85O_002665 [Saprospiraceae bacterium]|jgi:hypothetical protein
MEELQELISIVTKYKLRSVEVIGNVATTDSKYQEFYDLINSEKVRDDESAAAYYGLQPTDKKYRRLKQGLKSRLGNMLFLTDGDHPDMSEFQKKKIKGIKDWFTILLLRQRGAKAFTVDLVKNSFKDLEKIEYSKGLLDYSVFLMTYYSTQSPNSTEFTIWNDNVEKYLLIYSAEVKSLASFYKIIQPHIKNKGYNSETVKLAKIEIAKLKPYKEKVSTGIFMTMYYMILVMEKMGCNDYDATIQVCEEVISKMQKKTYFAGVNISLFFHNMIACLIYTRQYTKAETIFNESQIYITEGRNDWFADKNLYISLQLHQQKLQIAWDTFQEVSAHPKYKKLSQHYLESWKILEAWLYLAAKKGKIEIEETHKKRFRLSKFLNEMPLFSQDKSGMNIQIILLQTAWSLKSGKYDDVTDRIDALKKYTSRHLDKNTNMRSNCLIRMIIKLAEESFHKTNTLVKTEKIYTQMQTKSPNIMEEAHDLEIVPYELIWEWILEECGNEFR